MRDWLLAGIGLAVGVGVGTRWPRRRRFAITAGPRWARGGWRVSSAVPFGAKPMPGNDECIKGRHDGLAWEDRVVRFPWWKPWEGRRTEITGATCGQCGRPQSKIRMVYPADSTIRLPDSRHRPHREPAMTRPLYRPVDGGDGAD